jgi:hypothetical protein
MKNQIIHTLIVSAAILGAGFVIGKIVKDKPQPVTEAKPAPAQTEPETPKVNPNIVKPTSTEIQKSKYKLIAENIELKEQMEEINANYKALEQRTKHRMSQLEHHAESNRKQNRNLIDSLAVKREEAERMKKEAEVQKKMYLSRFASLVNVMKENNELREWKKAAIAAGLKLPKGPVTKPDYVRPPKNVRPAPVIIDPNTGEPIPDPSKVKIVPPVSRITSRPVPINNPALAESLRQYRKALEAAKNRKAIEASKREKK